MSGNFGEIISFLKELGIENVTKGEKKALYKVFENSDSVRKLRGDLDLLFAINQSLVSSYEKVSVSNMLEIYKTIDAKLLLNLSTMYELCRMKSKDELEALKRFREVVVKTLQTNEVVNDEVGRMLDSAFKKSLELKDSLYLTMRSKEQANALFDNCVRRAKTFIRQCESSNLEKIIYCLKNDFSLTDEELVSISKKCASFFVASSVSKINNLNKQIIAFKDYIRKQSSVMSTAVEIDKLLKKDFKEVLFDASSVATYNSENLNKTIRFLMGEKIGDIVFTNKRIGGIKGDFTPFQLAKIYNESISSLGATVEKIADVCDNLDEVYRTTFGRELNLNKLINGHNFSSISQLSKEDYLKEEKISEILKVLSMFITAEDMENLLRNNLSFLVAPVEAVKSSLQNAVLESENKDDLRRNVLQKIRNHFDIYEGGFKEVLREKKAVATSSSLNKVGIKDIDEEELKEVLAKLKTNPEDIEKWVRRWNREEKEYRNLEIQIELEELNEKVDRVKEFSDISFGSIEQFEEEVCIVKEMFEELESEYRNILEGKKLNKSLNELANKVSKNIQETSERINYSIEQVIHMFEEEAASLRVSLQECEKTLSKETKKQSRVEELDALIEERGIIEETSMKKMDLYNEVRQFVERSDLESRRIAEKEKLINKYVNEFFLFIRKQKTEEILKGGISMIPQIEKAEDLINVRFYTFIRSLEIDGLIDEVKKPSNIKIKDMPYKQFRLMLNDKEREIADTIHRLSSENMDARYKLREEVVTYLEKMGIDDNEEMNFHEKMEELLRVSVALEDELNSIYEIVSEREKYDLDLIKSTIGGLLEEKSRLDEQVASLCEKIDLLRKNQIKR